MRLLERLYRQWQLLRLVQLFITDSPGFYQQFSLRQSLVLALILGIHTMNKPAVRKKPESKLLAAIRLAVGARQDFLLARINTGVFCRPDDPKARIRSAPDGFPDIIGTQLCRVTVPFIREHTFGRHEDTRWHYYGQAVAIETKALKGRQSEVQADWQAAFEGVGGIYIMPRSVDEVLDVLGPEPDWVREFLLERNANRVRG